MAEYLTNTTDLTKVASAIREKGGTSDPLVYPDGFVTAIGNIQTGGGTAPGAPGDITFYDYDGTIITSWTLEELATKTALPDYPSHEGLTCQGWNWSLADLKTTNRKMNVGAMYITDDGKTRIYIRLEEGRTSPMLGVCPNGTVTVDWGDGTTPDTLTGTDTTVVKWTPNHAYAAPGEYVIKLTVDGTISFENSQTLCQILKYSSGTDDRDNVYRNSIQKIEIGSGVQSIGKSSFSGCGAMTAIVIPSTVSAISSYAFQNCSALNAVVFSNSLLTVGDYVFRNCFSVKHIALSGALQSVGVSVCEHCESLQEFLMPESLTTIGNYMLRQCYVLRHVSFPSATSIARPGMLNYDYSLTHIKIPSNMALIASYSFAYCHGMAVYDFSNHASVPRLSNANAFDGIAADCQIRVPASLVATWKAATNWSTYADHIVGV